MNNGNQLVMSGQYRADSADIVIIGNGIAGLTAAVEARRLSPDARIVIITEQCHPTINTPALKQFAIGKLNQEQLLAYPAGTERAQRIHILNARVEGINAQGKYVSLKGGLGFGYGSLLIATGSVPNGLPANLPGRDFDGVLTLHCLQDYLNLRRRLGEVNSAAVIGGGAHAVETVMGLLHYGVEVHWLIRSDTFLSKMLDSYASELVLENIRSAGVKVYTNTELVGVVGRVGSVAGVVTSQHNLIPCQLVLVCTGTQPVTTLARSCNIPMLNDRGILVDDQFRTNVRDIYAAGDVAARKNPQTGAYETHAQWYDAVLQGRTAAAAMTGHYESASCSMGVPWHATSLGAFSMLTVGNPLHKIAGAVILTNSARKKYRRISVIDDQLVGYLSLGSTQPDSLAIKRIIDEGLSIRDVKKILLKGDFDARKYFSQSRSQAARNMVTSGKLPVVHQPPSSLPVTDPLAHAYSRPGVVTTPLAHAYPPPGVVTGTLSSPPPAGPANAVYMGSPQTGPLREPAPVFSPLCNQPTIHEWRTESISSSISNQPTIHEWRAEAAPSSDKLPIEAKKVVDSMLVSLPSRPAARNLWSYSQKIPAVTLQPRPAAHNLWSYSQKVPAITLRQAPARHSAAARSEKVGQDKQGDRTNFLL